MSAKPLTAEDLCRVVCPVCHQALQLKDDAIQCSGCHRRYPIVDGIPLLHADRALSM
ncbi:MAG: Trm112 family protein [Edaphobacter sp.]